MAIKFQYNKTSLQLLEKQLKVRVRTLPIIKNKESALRMEVKRCKTEAADLEERLEKQIQAYEAMFALWNEFDTSLIKVNDVHLGIKKIAGVRRVYTRQTELVGTCKKKDHSESEPF